MPAAMIYGDFVGGSALAFCCKANSLVCGILPEKGDVRWFPGLQIDDFSDGRAVVYDPALKRCGAIDRQGDFVLEARFTALTAFAEGRSFAVGDDLCLLDEEGKPLQRFPRGCRADPFHEGLAVVRECLDGEQGGRYGLVDRRGEFAIPLRYRWSGREHPHETDGKRCGEGLVCVETDGRYGYVDTVHRPVIGPAYEGGRRFSEGLAAVRKGGKWGYIDREEKLVLPHAWDDAMPFSEGLAGVECDGRWGCIDRKGRLAVPADFSELSPFLDGHAVARTDFGCGLIDRAGQFVVPPIYDQISHFHEGIARVSLRETSGVLDRTLAVLWDETVR